MTRAEMTEDQELTLNAWLVFHGVNLAETIHVELTTFGYMHIFYGDAPDAIISIISPVPEWL